MDHDGLEQRSWNDYVDDGRSETESIEDVVRDTVDRLVAITILNTAPFVVNMFTAGPSSANSTDSKISNHSFGTHVSRRTLDPRSLESMSTQSPSHLFTISVDV